MRNGYWSLATDDSIFDTPLDVGQWHDVKTEINWSATTDIVYHTGFRCAENASAL